MLVKTLHQDAFPGDGMDQSVAIPWYASQYTANPKSAGKTPALELENSFPDDVGNKFKFGHLDLSGSPAAVISAGALLTLSAPGTDTVSSSLTDATSGLVYGIVLVTGNLTPNAEVGNYLYMNDLGILKRIKANTATQVIFSLQDTFPRGYDAEAIAAGPAGSSAVSIIRPGHVVVNATPGVPVGVLLNDTLEGSDIVYQTKGLGLIIGNNSGVALVVGAPATPAANGIIEGGGAAATLAGDWYIVPLIAYDSTNIRVPCYFKMLGAGA